MFDEAQVAIAQSPASYLRQTGGDINNYMFSPQGLTEEIEIGFALYTMSRPTLKAPKPRVAQEAGLTDLQLVKKAA